MTVPVNKNDRLGKSYAFYETVRFFIVSVNNKRVSHRKIISVVVRGCRDSNLQFPLIAATLRSSCDVNDAQQVMMKPKEKYRKRKRQA